MFLRAHSWGFRLFYLANKITRILDSTQTLVSELMQPFPKVTHVKPLLLLNCQIK